ncbi:hypothetical protein EV421DRAFT_2021088 [Armillaria borealis]|uniref:Uncharacterized protein n=1 Tax=Armillaria borealis TaxID=47425 RepID=A0AA39MM44_9AGAR|nr:hypothetical protein EV421DRAFT_2021088 [Armillaria borealis]
MSGVESHDSRWIHIRAGKFSGVLKRRLTLEARIDPSTLSGTWCLVERRRWMHHEERSAGVLGNGFPRCLSSSSSVVFGMYPESYLLCQLMCTREARRVCGGRGTRVKACTSSYVRRQLNALDLSHICLTPLLQSFEADVGAHTERRECGECSTPLRVGARREMDLHRSRPTTTNPTLPIRLLACYIRRRVDGTTRMVGPAWDFWVYPPSITVRIHNTGVGLQR